MTDSTFVVRDARPGFLRVDNDLYDRFGAQLGPYGLAVYVALCRYANRDSECWPSYATVARGTGMSRRKVIYEVAKLEALGVIAVDRNHNTSNVFTLLDTSVLGRDGVHTVHRGVVHDVHSGSARRAPKQSPMNKGSHKNYEQDIAGYIPEKYSDIIIR